MSQSIDYLTNDFTGNYDLTDNNQHGVWARKSVVTKAAVYFIESKIKSVHKDEPCEVILMDISKTFDNIDHSALLEKLKILGNHKIYS